MTTAPETRRRAVVAGAADSTGRPRVFVALLFLPAAAAVLVWLACQIGMVGPDGELWWAVLCNTLGVILLIRAGGSVSSPVSRAPKARCRVAIEALPQLVWTCEADGPCDYLSPQWVAYTGVAEQAQLGYGWLEQVHPDDRDRVQAAWRQGAPRGDAYDIEFRIRRHDGVYRWFKTRAAPLRDGRGRIVKWLGTNTDIQDLRDAQEPLPDQSGARGSRRRGNSRLDRSARGSGDGQRAARRRTTPRSRGELGARPGDGRGGLVG